MLHKVPNPSYHLSFIIYSNLKHSGFKKLQDLEKN